MEYSWKRNVLKYGIFRKWQSKTKAFCYKSQTRSSTFWNIKHFRIWDILEYGIFWNMEKNWKRNILKYGIFGIRQSKTKQFVFSHKTFLPYFGIWHILENGIFWNMEYSKIWNILENGIFLNMEYLENEKVEQHNLS